MVYLKALWHLSQCLVITKTSSSGIFLLSTLLLLSLREVENVCTSLIVIYLTVLGLAVACRIFVTSRGNFMAVHGPYLWLTGSRAWAW